MIIKQNKLKFNQTAHELMKYDKKAVINDKLDSIQNEIKELNDKYEADLSAYQMREKYLKASVKVQLYSSLPCKASLWISRREKKFRKNLWN